MNRKIERTTAFRGFNTDSRHPVTVKNVVQGVESLELFKLAEVALLIKFHRSNPLQITESLGASSVLSPHRKRDIPEWIFWRSLRCKYISRITGRLFAFISSSLEGSHKQGMESGVHWIQQRGNWILFHWSQSRAAAVPLSRLHFRSLGVWNILLSLLVLIPPFATIQLDGSGLVHRYCWLNYNVAILLLPSDDVRCPIFPLYRRGFHQQKREGGSTWWWW